MSLQWFLHKAVVRKRTQKHPVFLGPMLIHQRLNMEAYRYFAHHIQILLPSLRSIKALGTDGELALTGTLDTPSQILFTCAASSTFKTTDSKLRALNLDDVAREEILADIVGVEGLEQRQVKVSLVDAVNSSNFDTKLARLEERWNKMEKEGRRVVPGEHVKPEFYSWFVSEKRDVVRNIMIGSVRKAAQLGDPPEKFYTNASESTNNVLKLKIGGKGVTSSFHGHKPTLEHGLKNIERVFYRRGDWRLADALALLEELLRVLVTRSAEVLGEETIGSLLQPLSTGN